MNNAYTPVCRREYQRARYQAHRQEILAKAAARKAERDKAASEAKADTFAKLPEPEDNMDVENIRDDRQNVERRRAENMESIRLRLLWAMAAGGDEGTVARTAIAVIRFAERDARHWTDRSLRWLHARLAKAEGLTGERFEAALAAVAHDLFLPV